MRCRAGWTPFIILVPLAALASLLCGWLGATAHHTIVHLPEVLEAQLSAALRREVRIGRVAGDFWHGFELHDVAVARSQRLSGGALLRIRRVRVHYALDALLRRTAPPLESIRAIEIDQPWVYVSRDASGRLNLQDLLPPGPPRKGPPARFPAAVVVRRGTIVFEDHGVPGGRPVTHRLTDLDLTLDGRAAPLYTLSLRAQGDRRHLARIAIFASANPEAKNASVVVHTEGIRLTSWLPYIPARARLPVSVDGGTVSADASLLVMGGKVADFGARVALRDASLRVPQVRSPLHRIAATIDLAPDRLVARDVCLSAGRITLRGSATVTDFKRPWVQAQVHTGGIGESDVRALVPGIPPLPDTRLGTLNHVEIAVRGRLPDLAARVRCDLSFFSRPEVAASDIHLEARLNGRKQVILEALTGRVAGGTFAGTGTVEMTGQGPRYDVQAAVRGVHLQHLGLARRPRGPGAASVAVAGAASMAGAGAAGTAVAGTAIPTLAGTVSADVHVRGTGSQPEAQARLDLFRARLGEWQADSVQADCSLRNSVVEVRQAQVRLPEGVATALGTVDLRGPLNLQVAATQVDLGALAKRFKLEPVRGHAYVRGEVGGQLASPEFRGELAAYNLGYGDHGLEMLRARVLATMKEVRLEECRGLMLPAQIGNVTIALSDPRAGTDAEVTATGTIYGLDVGELAKRLKLDGDWGGTVDVEELEISGPLSAPQVAARITARNLRAGGQAIDEVTGRATAMVRLPKQEGSPVAFTVSVDEADPVLATVLGAGRGPQASTQVRAWGTVSSEHGFDVYVATAAGKPIRPEDFYAPPPPFSIAGEIGFDVHVTGPLDNPAVRGGTLTVQRLVVNGHEFGEGSGAIDASKERVAIDQLVLIDSERRQTVATGGPAAAARRAQYELTGTLWPQLGLTARVVQAPVQKLLTLAGAPRPGVDLDGAVTALIRVTQPVQQAEDASETPSEAKRPPLQVSLTRLQVDGGRVGPQQIARLTADGVALQGDAVRVQSLDLATPEGASLHLDGTASLLPDGPLALDVRVRQLDLALLQLWVALPAALGGVGSLDAAVRGTLSRPTLDGTLSVADPRYGSIPMTSLAARFGYDGTNAEVRELVLRRDPYVASGRMKVRLDWENVLPPKGGQQKEERTRKLIADDAPIEGEVVLAEESLDGLALLMPMVLSSGEYGEALKEGRLHGRLQVSERFGQPKLEGALTFRCPMLVIGSQPKGREPQPALHLFGLDGVVRVESDHVVVDRLSVASAEWPKDAAMRKRLRAAAESAAASPRLKLDGAVSLRGFAPDEVDLRLAANGFQFEERNLTGQFQEKVRVALNGNATVQGPWASPLVAGDLAVDDAVIDMSRFVAPPAAEKRRQLPVNPRFRVNVVTKQEARVLAARTVAFVAIPTCRLEGSLDQILLSGKATATGGSVTLPTAHFRLKSADLDFRLNQAQAETGQALRATGTAVLTTNLRGRNPRTGKEDTFAVTATVAIDYPSRSDEEPPVQMKLESRPFVEERSLYPMLMRTDVIEGLVSGGNGNLEDQLKKEAMAFMATALQPYVLQPLERAIAERLGLTEFSIQASVDEPVEVKLGKYLLKDLRVSYQRSVTAREARYTFKVDYEVIDRVSVSWSTDEKRNGTVGLEAGIQF